MILPYCKYEMHSKVNKANKEGTSPLVSYEYNQNMTANHMFQPHLLELRDGSKWDAKLFIRLLNAVINNSTITHQSTSDTF
jgi:hypothetical protein